MPGTVCDECGRNVMGSSGILTTSYASGNGRDLCYSCYDRECPECRDDGAPSGGEPSRVQSKQCSLCNREYAVFGQLGV